MVLVFYLNEKNVIIIYRPQGHVTRKSLSCESPYPTPSAPPTVTGNFV